MGFRVHYHYLGLGGGGGGGHFGLMKIKEIWVPQAILSLYGLEGLGYRVYSLGDGGLQFGVYRYESLW